MTRTLTAMLVITLLQGCSCSDTGLQGEPDADDPGTDTTDTGIDPVPMCWDLDDDGHDDETCGGDDCDDSDPTIHPGADDVCLDGVDRDCDGIVDGPMLLGSVVQLARNSEDGPGVFLAPGTLAWTGSEYAVSITNGGPSPSGLTSVGSYLSRLDPDGSLTMDSVWLWNRVTNRFALSGSELGFIGSGIPTSPGLRFLRVNLSGSVITDPLLVSYDASFGNIAWSGEDYVLIWRNPRGSDDIYYGRLDAEGTVTHEGTPLTDHAGEVDGFSINGLEILWNGSATGLVWQESVDGVEGHEEVIFASVPHDHTGLVTKKRLTYSASLNRRPALTWTGSEYGIVWEVFGEEAGIMFARVDPDGELMSEPCFLADSGIAPQISWTGSEFGVGYGTETDPGSQVNLILLGASGTIEEGTAVIPLASASTSHNMLQVWTGSEFGIVWTDTEDETTDVVLFQRIGLCD